jgi:hypothetical protein
MAPEQARGENVDARADLYAIGACMFHALSGRLPFEAASAPALLYAILEQVPPELSSMRSDVPVALSQIITRAMSKHPDARFANADEMRVAIEQSAMAPQVSPASFAATVAARPFVPRAPSKSGVPTWVWIAGGVGLLGALGALGVVAVAGGAAFLLGRAPAPVAASSSLPASSAGAIAAVTTSTEVAAEKVAPRASSTGSPARTVAPAVTSAAPATAPIKSGDAGSAVAATKPTGRKTAHMNSITAGNLFTLEQIHAGIDNPAVQAQVNACYAASEMDPVDHQFTMWQLLTRPNGDVVSVGGIPGATAERSPRLDACMGRVLGGVHFGAPNKAEASEVRVGFEAELPWKK